MGFPALLKATQGLNASTEALAAVGAMLKARLDGTTIDPRVAAPKLGSPHRQSGRY